MVKIVNILDNKRKAVYPATVTDAIVDIQDDGSAVRLPDILNAMIDETASKTTIGAVSDMVLSAQATSRTNPCTIEMGINPIFYGNRMLFVKASDIVIERAPRGTDNWVNGGYSDSEKASLFNGLNTGSVTFTKAFDLRITISNSDRYCRLDRFYSWFSSAGAFWKIQLDKIESSGEITNIVKNQSSVSGWSGPAFIRHPAELYCNYDNSDSRARKLRITIRTVLAGNINDTKYPNQTLQGIQWFGDMLWLPANNMMRTGQLYAWDNEQNAIFPKKISVAGGTSSQFLKADGSVDNTNYNEAINARKIDITYNLTLILALKNSSTSAQIIAAFTPLGHSAVILPTADNVLRYDFHFVERFLFSADLYTGATGSLLAVYDNVADSGMIDMVIGYYNGGAYYILKIGLCQQYYGYNVEFVSVKAIF